MGAGIWVVTRVLSTLPPTVRLPSTLAAVACFASCLRLSTADAALSSQIPSWLGKIKRGGIIAGHDFCRSNPGGNEADARPPGGWHWGRHCSMLHGDKATADAVSRPPHPHNCSRFIPQCGVYGCFAGELCHPEDERRAGKPRLGYTGAVKGIVEQLSKAGLHIHLTLDGRPAGKAFCATNGSGNPSWWAVV
jgi:hypothetical protein